MEGNLLAARQEVDKLALLYPAGELTLEQLRAAVANVARFDVFHLSESWLAGDVPRVLRMLDGLMAEGEAPVLVLWSLTEDVRMLLRLRQGLKDGRNARDMARELRLWGDKQRLAEPALRRIGPRKLMTALDECARIDRQIKGVKPAIRGGPCAAWRACWRLDPARARPCLHRFAPVRGKQESTMALFDSLSGLLSGGAEGGAGGALQALLQQQGGLSGLLEQFQQGGLGELVSSWVGQGGNLPVSAEQIQQVLGSEQLSGLAEKFGLEQGQLSQLVAEHLPGLVDKLTPNGQLPQGEDLLSQERTCSRVCSANLTRPCNNAGRETRRRRFSWEQGRRLRTCLRSRELRRDQEKTSEKRNVHVVHEHFELGFNAVSPTRSRS